MIFINFFYIIMIFNEDLIINLTNNYTSIISINDIKNNEKLYWGGNGIGDRWMNKKYNYAVIYSNKKYKVYSENDDNIPDELISNFIDNQNKGIIGIFVFSKRNNVINRTINKKIYKEIIKNNCIICGSNTDIICDHKNDLYNDIRVLNTKTQIYNDFQPLCNHCNLQKRQIAKIEEQNNKIYSAKNIKRYLEYNFEFPWEKKYYDKKDINCKKDTYWYDPVEFERKIYKYLLYTIPIITEIKTKIKVVQ
jgi:hypothetical protein